jgi:hypothetical protein
VQTASLQKVKLEERSANETFTWYGRYKEN